MAPAAALAAPLAGAALRGWVWAGFVLVLGLAYLIAGCFFPYGSAGIVGAVAGRFLPVWIALIVTFALSVGFKRHLGLYGKLYDSNVGMVGFGLVLFWVYHRRCSVGSPWLDRHPRPAEPPSRG